MPTPTGDQFKLYHGTTGNIKGGVIRPSARGAYGPGVYSTNRINEAETYSRQKIDKADIDPETGEPDGKTTRPMFGTVYEIDPTDSTPVNRYGYHVNPNPTKIKRVASFPLGAHALPLWGDPSMYTDDEDED
jgi:hypothetical protein